LVFKIYKHTTHINGLVSAWNSKLMCVVCLYILKTKGASQQTMKRL
jgi:hypothetical protein